MYKKERLDAWSSTLHESEAVRYWKQKVRDWQMRASLMFLFGVSVGCVVAIFVLI